MQRQPTKRGATTNIHVVSRLNHQPKPPTETTKRTEEQGMTSCQHYTCHGIRIFHLNEVRFGCFLCCQTVRFGVVGVVDYVYLRMNVFFGWLDISWKVVLDMFFLGWWSLKNFEVFKLKDWNGWRFWTLKETNLLIERTCQRIWGV